MNAEWGLGDFKVAYPMKLVIVLERHALLRICSTILNVGRHRWWTGKVTWVGTDFVGTSSVNVGSWWYISLCKLETART